MRTVTDAEFDTHYHPRRSPGADFNRRGGSFWADVVARIVAHGPQAVRIPEDIPAGLTLSPDRARHRLSLEGRVMGVPLETTIAYTDLGVEVIARAARSTEDQR